MAGPAGGSGGGHRSGGFGGGFGGGPRRGGFFGGPRFFFFGRPRYYYGYGGGLAGLIVLPIIIALFSLMLLIFSIVDTIGIVSQGGIVEYDEQKFQDYAYSSYYQAFDEPKTREDGLLFVVLTYENKKDVSYIAFCGDNIQNRINDVFGANAEFGMYVERCVNSDNYQYSLSKDLSKVVDYMAVEVSGLGLDSSFIVEHNMEGAPESKLTNKSQFDINSSTVGDSLERFTQETKIPVSLVVDDAEAVFGKTVPASNIVILVLMAVIIIVCVVIIIKRIRARKKFKNSVGENENNRYGTGIDEDLY